METQRIKPSPKLINTIWFWLIFIMLLSAASYAVAPAGGEVYDIEHTIEKIESVSYEKQDTIDVFFAGNSLVFRDLSPLQIWGLTGITTYDLSDGAMRLCDQWTLIQNACRMQKPKLIVLEANMIFTDASPYKDDYALPTNLIEKAFPIFHYHTAYKAWHTFWDSEDHQEQLKGFQPSYDVLPYTGDTDYMNQKGKKSVIPELNRRYLDKIISFCDDNGIDLMISAMPSPANYDKGTHKAVQKWADDKGLTFVDLNLLTEEIGIDWETDTKDAGDHMNFEGSGKVSAYMADYLCSHYAFEDHRQDNNYKQWNDIYDEAGLY